jgi:hypothetical protein
LNLQCIAINDQWAKGYVRLASAYIALGGHSNDACNTLQRALQLDPTNPTARQMLVRELRREQHGSAPSAPPQDQDDEGVGDPTQIPVDQDQIDDSISFKDRMKFYYTRAYMWYHGQSEDFRTILKVFVVILLLYVAFGGRFGLEYTSQKVNRGNYGVGNAYDRYYSRDSGKPAGADNADYNSNPRQQQNTHDNSQRRTGTTTGERYDSRDTRRSNSRYDTQDDYDYQPRRSRDGGGGDSSFHFPNLLDGSPQSMMIMMGIVYVCYRNGINPMQAIFFMNMMGGRGRPRGFGNGGGFGRGMGGFGRGMGGFGGGMRHGMGRPQRRNGWY